MRHVTSGSGLNLVTGGGGEGSLSGSRMPGLGLVHTGSEADPYSMAAPLMSSAASFDDLGGSLADS